SPTWSPDGGHFAAVVNGRVVIADAGGHVVRTIGPPGVQSVQWVGSG
ncbi:MAG: hypothetical protein QOI15_337, partial [Pseudonocardiales bacterium]|nr:hypothetical protein [Pseudonocardiales bacterium]